MATIEVRVVRYADAYVTVDGAPFAYMERSAFTGEWLAYRWDAANRAYSAPSFRTERKTAKAAAKAAHAHFGASMGDLDYQRLLGDVRRLDTAMRRKSDVGYWSNEVARTRRSLTERYGADTVRAALVMAHDAVLAERGT